MKNYKLFDLEIFYVKLKYSNINFIKAICGNATPPFKMEIRLVYTGGNMRKNTENHAAKLSCSLFQLSTMHRRNHFHIFLSLAVNYKNKFLKVYCVLRL